MKCEKPMSENQKFYGNKLYKFLLQGGTYTKQEMLDHLGWDKKKDRQLRELLSFIGQKKPLIATSDREGYKLAKDEKDLEEVKHQWLEFDSRIEELNKRRKPLIEFYEKHRYN